MTDNITAQFANAMAAAIDTRTPKPVAAATETPKRTHNTLTKRQRDALADWLDSDMMRHQVIGQTCKGIADQFNRTVGWNHPLFKAPPGIKDTAAMKVSEWNIRHILINNGYGTLNYKIVKLDPVKMDELAAFAPATGSEQEPKAEVPLPVGISQAVVFTTSDGKSFTNLAAATEHESIGVLSSVIDDLLKQCITEEEGARAVAKYIRANFVKKA